MSELNRVQDCNHACLGTALCICDQRTRTESAGNLRLCLEHATNQPVPLSRSHTAWPRACFLMPLHSMSAPAHAPAKPASQQTHCTSRCASQRSGEQAVSLVSKLLAPAASGIVL